MRIGVDLGGTKIAAAIYVDGEERARLRVPTPVGDYAATVRALVDLVERLEQDHGRAAGVGVGTPGSIRRDGRMQNSNSVALNGRPLRADLEAALGRSVLLANDADCFALAEASLGAAAGADPVFGVIVGTGVGGGVVVRGRLVTGPNGLTGEWGHMPLPWPRADELPGPYCYCGRRGCVETWLSGPALEREHASTTGRRSPPAEVVQAAEQGDGPARQVLEAWADRFARSLAIVLDVVDPEVIVLGGGLSNVAYAYRRIPELWGRYAFADELVTRIAPPALGDDAGMLGAALLSVGAEDEHGDR